MYIKKGKQEDPQILFQIINFILSLSQKSAVFLHLYKKNVRIN